MKIQIDNLARQGLIDIYYYNYQYSVKNAIETNQGIYEQIEYLVDFPYLGRIIPELSDKRFREIIYVKSNQSRYRIMYYLSENSDTIYVFNIMNGNQSFRRLLKLQNYFKNYYNF